MVQLVITHFVESGDLAVSVKGRNFISRSTVIHGILIEKQTAASVTLDGDLTSKRAVVVIDKDKIHLLIVFAAAVAKHRIEAI